MPTVPFYRPTLKFTFASAALLVAGVFAPAGLSAPVVAASFDCDKPGLAADETALCANRDINDMDVKMVTTLELITGLLPMGNRGVVQDAQVEWLSKRQACGADLTCLRAAYARTPSSWPAPDIDSVVAFVALGAASPSHATSHMEADRVAPGARLFQDRGCPPMAASPARPAARRRRASAWRRRWREGGADWRARGSPNSSVNAGMSSRLAQGQVRHGPNSAMKCFMPASPPGTQ